MSATVPAPTACTEAAAALLRMRITMSMAMLTLTALMTEKTTKSKKDKKYVFLRPKDSEKADLGNHLAIRTRTFVGATHHHKGEIAMASM